MTYQFLCDYLYHIVQTLNPVSRNFKLTLDSTSYHILMADITTKMLPIHRVAALDKLNTQFGEVQIICLSTIEFCQKLELNI